MNRCVRLSFATVLVVTTTSYSHPGPRIWVGIEGGKVMTYAGPYPPSAASNYQRSTLFSEPLIDLGDDLWETDFPGFQKAPGRNIPTGTTFGCNITGPLLWFRADDPASCPTFVPVAEHFADSPPVPQMAVTNELFQTRVTSTGFVSGHPVYAYNGSDGDHNHLAYTLLGNGTDPGDGPDGIYLLQLQLTASGFVPSDTFYLMLGKNASAQQLALAAEAIEQPHIPPDLDCDGDVDGHDFGIFHSCMTARKPFPRRSGIRTLPSSRL